MIKLNGKTTDAMDFYKGCDPFSLTDEYGSPLYVYNETILRKNCAEFKSMCKYPGFGVNFSVKANSNLALLQIIRQEGLDADAMSPGEIHAELAAGFTPDRIFFIANNVSEDEMRFAVERGVLVSVDSISQLETFGKAFGGGDVAVRINPGYGAGHHEKVVTAGKNTKFGVNMEDIPLVKDALKKYSLKLSGINQHIGSLFMDDASFAKSVWSLLTVAEQFEGLDFIDLGGGFGIPYMKQAGEGRMDLAAAGARLDEIMEGFCAKYGRQVRLKVEPGRYITAEAGVLLGTVHAVKANAGVKYIGTDIGQNVLMRPVLYDAWHDVEVYRRESNYPPPVAEQSETVTVVGNICETGDILAKERALPPIKEKDLVAVLDAGSYGHSMSSTYNNRPKAAEVLIRTDGNPVLIRKRDSLDDLLINQAPLERVY